MSAASDLKTILLLQDEPPSLDLYGRALTAKGYGVIPACTAAEALMQFISTGRRVHLLIADLRLRGSSGLHVARLLRAKCPRLRTILTAHHPRALWTRDETSDLMRLGIDTASVMVKPCSPEVLLDAVEAAIGLPKPEQEPVMVALRA